MHLGDLIGTDVGIPCDQRGERRIEFLQMRQRMLRERDAVGGE
jgi:hypothetical protein